MESEKTLRLLRAAQEAQDTKSAVWRVLLSEAIEEQDWNEVARLARLLADRLGTGENTEV